MTCALRVEMVEEKGFSEEENAREGLSTNERDDWFLNFREVLGLQKKNSACFRSALALTALASEKANKENCSLTQHHLNHFSTSSSLHGPGTRSRARPRTRPLREGPQRRRRDEQQRRRCLQAAAAARQELHRHQGQAAAAGPAAAAAAAKAKVSAGSAAAETAEVAAAADAQSVRSGLKIHGGAVRNEAVEL